MRAFRSIPVIEVFRKRRFARHSAWITRPTVDAGKNRLETLSDFLCLARLRP